MPNIYNYLMSILLIAASAFIVCTNMCVMFHVVDDYCTGKLS